MSFEIVTQFEKQIASFYGAPFAIATDSCTHAIELCIRYQNLDRIVVPHHTYISIPFLADKLNIARRWKNFKWTNFYNIVDFEALSDSTLAPIYDAAVHWRQNAYEIEFKGSFACLSFQYQKHLGLGRGGMILCDNESAASALKKMSYDGRNPIQPWREQDIDTIGYHYYMTPETAKLGLEKFDQASKTKPRQWVLEDWPDLTKMKVFQNEQ